eukprot:8760564-Karenia_brevis.AAC.1
MLLTYTCKHFHNQLKSPECNFQLFIANYKALLANLILLVELGCICSTHLLANRHTSQSPSGDSSNKKSFQMET